VEANWSDPEYVRGRARRKTIWIVGFALHIALFALLVGWPYVRGEMRGRDSRRAFGAFAACFYGGEVTGAAGLSLPEGDRLAYASHYLSADPEWPGRCRPLLSALIDGEPILLYPGVKGAEERVRQVAALADAVLEELTEARSARGGRIPLEPLEAVTLVAGTLADLAREIDPLTPIEDEVIRLGDVDLPDPARVPLTTAADGVIHVEARADGIRVRAVDARGLSRTRSAGGRSRAGRIRRTGTARAMLDAPEGDDPIVVLATNPNRCPEDPHRCSRRSTGIATWVFGEGTTEPIWLSGHPRGRIDRTVRITEHELWMVVVGEGGEGAELRWFHLPHAEADSESDSESDSDSESGEGEGEGETTPAMLAADLRLVLDGVGPGDDVLLLEGGRVLYSATGDDGEVRFFAVAAGLTPTLLAELSGSAPFIVSCPGRPFSVFGTSTGVVVVEEAEAGPIEGHRRDIALGAAPFDARRPSRDRLRLACDDAGASLGLHHGDGRLEVLTCARGETCGSPIDVAPHAAAFDLVRSDGATVVAWHENDDDGAVHATTLGEAPVPARVIAACFADGEGFCGAPRIAERNGRILVVTQEGADLRVLESTDQGQTFQRMTGVR